MKKILKILALDTSQAYCSVALGLDGALLCRERHAPRRHTEHILPQVESVLAEAGLRLAELDALAFGRGPGSFTGLRIAAGVAQGLALGADLPVAPISSLAALAQGRHRGDNTATHICAAVDARLGEVYWGCYAPAAGVVESVRADALGAPADLHLSAEHPWAGVGDGWAAYPEMRRRLNDRLTTITADTAPLARDIIPLAARLIENGRAVGAEKAVPVYLRNKVARTARERAGA